MPKTDFSGIFKGKKADKEEKPKTESSVLNQKEKITAIKPKQIPAKKELISEQKTVSAEKNIPNEQKQNASEKIDVFKIKKEVENELKKGVSLEKELNEFHEKPKEVKEKESEKFDFNEITSQIKQKVQEKEKSKTAFDKIKTVVGKWTVERVPSGIQGLDELIEGGFEKGSSVLIVGSAGTGKSLFGLQFLYSGAIEYNEPGIFISFEEERESLYKHSNSFGWDFEELEKKNLFKVLQYKPHQVEKLMKEGGGTIKDQIKSMNAKRLVIDSITSYGLLFKDEYQRRENILAFFDLLHKWGCTSIIISELPPKVAEVKEGSVGFLTDAIISLYYSKEEEKAVRVHSCEILKMRGTRHTNKLLALAFEKKGIVIYPEVEVF
ncbi:MAG: hypothetical protein JW703_03080 [Candidatus Diapherotrites archaeon]|nr:hypothetical protein [Candidatus Diapherotrites archaeon]